MQEARNTLSEK